MSHLTPTLAFDGEDYLLMTPQLAGIARTELGTPVGNLATARQWGAAAARLLRRKAVAGRVYRNL